MKTNINFRQILLTIVASVLSLSAQADQMGTKDFVPPQDGMPKDILVEQQDLYTISPGNGHYSNTTTNNRKPPVSIWVNHKNNTYAFGDQIVISAKASRDGYLTIIDVGTSRTIRQLFPNKYQPNNYVRKGQIIQIPARNANFKYTVAGPAGTELIKAFLTDNPGNIYGRSSADLNDDIFPLISANSKALRKDIVTTLNTNHANRWNAYNKVIYIVPRAGASSQNYSPQYDSAMRAEQALRLNRAQIRDIQRFLRQANFYHGSIDGQIGRRTRDAIRAWQRSVNLPATGYIDSETFTRIMN